MAWRGTAWRGVSIIPKLGPHFFTVVCMWYASASERDFFKPWIGWVEYDVGSDVRHERDLMSALM